VYAKEVSYSEVTCTLIPRKTWLLFTYVKSNAIPQVPHYENDHDVLIHWTTGKGWHGLV
jgi:hypothetical protein